MRESNEQVIIQYDEYDANIIKDFGNRISLTLFGGSIKSNLGRNNDYTQDIPIFIELPMHAEPKLAFNPQCINTVDSPELILELESEDNHYMEEDNEDYVFILQDAAFHDLAGNAISSLTTNIILTSDYQAQETQLHCKKDDEEEILPYEETIDVTDRDVYLYFCEKEHEKIMKFAGQCRLYIESGFVENEEGAENYFMDNYAFEILFPEINESKLLNVEGRKIEIEVSLDDAWAILDLNSPLHIDLELGVAEDLAENVLTEIIILKDIHKFYIKTPIFRWFEEGGDGSGMFDIRVGDTRNMQNTNLIIEDLTINNNLEHHLGINVIGINNDEIAGAFFYYKYFGKQLVPNEQFWQWRKNKGSWSPAISFYPDLISG